MADGFGKFKVLCRTVPSYPQCNLFFRQLASDAPQYLEGVDYRTAGVGINPQCAIPRLVDGNLGNIAQIIASGLSFFVVAFLIFMVGRRKAAVGRVEFRIFLFLYLLTLPLQILTTGAVLRQATSVLVILTAIHLGLVAALFWSLLGNAMISLQVVEDGTMASLVPYNFFIVAFFVATTYVSLDTAFTFTNAFDTSNPPDDLKNIPLFVLTSIWPLASAFLFFAIMTYVVLRILREKKPLAYYFGAGLLFVLSQLAYFLLSKVICKASDAKVDGSFIATVLETAAVVVLFLGWKSITEDNWDEPW